MYFCFVFGLEPWLLPPAIEMADALRSKGHEVKMVYAQYQGGVPGKKDYDPANTYEIIPKQEGLKRFFTHSYLAKAVKKMLSAHTVDVVIACDILSLQAISGINGIKKGYWGFEIVERPAKMKMSLYLYRASAFPSWVGKLDFFLAPSQSRVDKISARCRKKMPHEVIYNCRRYEDKADARTQKDTCKLVYTGRISATQYIEEIIDAAVLAGENCKLYIAGPVSNDYNDKLKSKIDANPLLHNRVFLLGRLSREDVYKLTETADIGFVFYNEQMGDEAKDPAPNKLSDYIAAGIWSIGGGQRYIKYWLEERNAGVCIKDIDKFTIAEAIKKILTDNKFKDRQVLKDIYHNELNMDAQADKLLSLIKNL